MHAKRRMRERNIEVHDVEYALTEPVQILYDIHRDVYLVLGHNGVAVVYAQRGNVIEVVTVMTRREYEALARRLANRRYRLIE